MSDNTTQYIRQQPNITTVYSQFKFKRNGMKVGKEKRGYPFRLCFLKQLKMQICLQQVLFECRGKFQCKFSNEIEGRQSEIVLLGGREKKLCDGCSVLLFSSVRMTLQFSIVKWIFPKGYHRNHLKSLPTVLF